MATFANDVNFDNNQALNMSLHSATTANLATALTVLAGLGYDTTLLRAKIYDGTTVRGLLQTNDVGSSDLGSAVTGSYLLASASAIKSYIDNAVTSGQQAFTDYDASATTNFPAGATLASRYRVSVAGTVQGVTLQVGDIFWSKVASPSTTSAGDWIFAQGNVDYATTSILGLVLLATLSEIQTNSAPGANKVITVAQLNAWESALGRIKKFTLTNQSLTAGANTITHNLGTALLTVNLMDANGPLLANFTRPTAQTIVIQTVKARSGIDLVILA